MNHAVSITTTQFWLYRVKAIIDNINEWMWLWALFQYFFFLLGSGPDLATHPCLPTPGSEVDS